MHLWSLQTNQLTAPYFAKYKQMILLKYVFAMMLIHRPMLCADALIAFLMEPHKSQLEFKNFIKVRLIYSFVLQSLLVSFEIFSSINFYIDIFFINNDNNTMNK